MLNLTLYQPEKKAHYQQQHSLEQIMYTAQHKVRNIVTNGCTPDLAYYALSAYSSDKNEMMYNTQKYPLNSFEDPFFGKSLLETKISHKDSISYQLQDLIPEKSIQRDIYSSNLKLQFNHLPYDTPVSPSKPKPEPFSPIVVNPSWLETHADQLKEEVGEEVLEAIRAAVEHHDINHLYALGQRTLTRVNGGRIVKMDLRGKGVVLKVDPDSLAAEKAARTQSIIHSLSYNPLLTALAERVPHALWPRPIRYQGLTLTLHEDVSERRMDALPFQHHNQFDGLDSSILHLLYSMALFHETMQDTTDPIISCISSRNKPWEVITKRAEPHSKHLGTILREAESRYKDYLAQCEEETQLRTIIIGDPKQANFVQGCIVDLGSVQAGDEVEDLGKVFKDYPELCADPELMDEYTRSYMRIRRQLQAQIHTVQTSNYAPQQMPQRVRRQAFVDAVRELAWRSYAQQALQPMITNVELLLYNQGSDRVHRQIH